jgi:GNAT superfamily N-acetyltransferase
MRVRRAQLEDTLGISAIFRARIERWQRLTPEGQVEDVAYEQLSLYEQWQHGGPWMNAYTATLWLSHVLRRAGLPYVAAADGQIVAYAEVFPNVEAPPYGRHWHIAQMLTLPGFTEARDVLIQAILKDAEAVGRVSVNLFTYDEDNLQFYSGCGFTKLETITRYDVKTQMGQGFYRAVPHPNADPSQISGWHMPIGRVGSAAEQWHRVWPGIWDAVPSIAAEPIHRLHLSASGQEAYVCCQQDLYDPRLATVYCWSNKAASPALMIAIRDWAHRAGYRTLAVWGSSELVKLLSNDSEPTAQQRVVLVRTL